MNIKTYKMEEINTKYIEINVEQTKKLKCIRGKNEL